jgi:PAS domain S-box-containing protein
MNLSWITIVWSGAAAACVTVALVHLSIWLKQPRRAIHLVFAILAVSVAANAACELMLMHAQTPAQFGELLRWRHVPLCVLVVSLVVYTRLYLGAGSLWLAGGVCLLRLAVLAINFYVEPNINFEQIESLRPLAVLGETVAGAEGAVRPWQWLTQLSILLALLFALHASVKVWRRGGHDERRRVVVVAGSFALFIVMAAGTGALAHAGVIQVPYMVSLYFLAIVAAAGYELSSDVVRAAYLAEQLKGSEAELRLSRQRIEHAAEAAQTGIWEWDMAHNELWVTDQFRRLFGFAPQDRVDVGRVIAKVHPADVETVRKAVTHMRTHGSDYDDLEFRVPHAGHPDRWIATRGRVVLDANGTPCLMRGVSLDITRRKRIESALRESEERFRSMADAAPVLIWMAGTDKLFTFFNQNWLNFTGRTLEREVGDGWFEGVHREDLAESLQTFSSAFDAREKFTMEYRLRAADGEYHWILDSGAPRLAPDGTFLGYIGSCVDITERKRADDMLKQERAFLRQVIDIDPNLIFAKNREGRFTLVNQAVADVYGTTVEKIVGKRHEDFGHNPAEAEHFRRVDRQVMDTGQEQFIAEEPITAASGRVLWLQTVKRPILDEKGHATQVLGSATDITRRKEAEFEFALQRNELTHLSRVAMLGELSGSLAHELNQPLTAILSNAQAAQRFLARDDFDLDEVRAILKDIVRDDKRAGEVIQGLRLLLTKGEMRRQPLDLNSVVSDVLRLVRSDLLNSGVCVNTELSPFLPMANGDRVQLQQVLINLVVNGCEAMATTASPVRHLLVRTALTEESGVCVSVSDMGHGIPSGSLERVFEPFFTTKSHGLGLGLAVCRTIISAQGGRLWAANNAGRGASFHFTLPAVAGSPA